MKKVIGLIIIIILGFIIIFFVISNKEKLMVNETLEIPIIFK